ncbi:MAG TPA: carbohydrate porin [Geminocystis sp. M7585_C2015_104]|nr:carbohydrate porin [Geminocystis sp. M7585_C2015_104]
MKAKHSLLATLAVTATVLGGSGVKAGEIQTLEEVEKYATQGGIPTQQQVTSVSQLRDVSPTDWAFEALRNLVERYGCIVGYPDRTFRGNRALSRYEFAAGLNACMQAIERLIAGGGGISSEDLERLQRLAREFEAELAALGAKVDKLEGRVAFLEERQFSTTTKLQGEAIFAVSHAGYDGNKTIFADRVRLVLNTSFTGQDSLITRLAAGNAIGFTTIDNFGYVGGSPTQTQTFNLYPGGGNNAQVDWLAYYAPPIKFGDKSELKIYIPAFGGIHSDYVPTLNPFFEDYDGGNGALSTFASESPIYRIGGGSGIALSYRTGFLESILGPTTFTVGYLAGNAASPQRGAGLFDGDYSVLAQINVNPNDALAFGFTYVRGFHKSGNDIFAAGGTTGIVGTPAANLGPFGDRRTNSYGAQVAWRISPGVSISGFFAYTDVELDSAIRSLLGIRSTDIWTYGGGIAFPDLGKEGSVLGIFAGVQPYFGEARRFPGNELPIHVEAFYKYKLNDNISITPGIIWLNSTTQGGSAEQVIGTLRTTFTF